MKKLVLTVAILVGSISVFAISNSNLTDQVINVIEVDEFKEIALEDLPEAVVLAVSKDFASSTISQAFVNSSSQYKLLVDINGEVKTIYADADGNWLEESDIVVE